MEDLVGQLVGLRGHGVTDLAAALRAARAAAAGHRRGRTGRRPAVGLPAHPGDAPESALAGIDRLHVLFPLPTPEVEEAARALAARGGGQALPVRTLTDIGPALSRLLG